jgi:CubicO group peptidase (beta-lactamase class C family)
MSAAIGIAIHKGFIAGTWEKLGVFYPEYAHLFDSGKNKITLRNVITKTPGFSWNEHDVPYEDAANDWNQMRAGDDPIGYVLARPLVHEPGEFWYYNSGCAYLLAGMIRKRTGLFAHEFMRIHLFEPLGITDVEWIDTHSTGLHNTAAGLYLRPRDMAKLGLLYINMGLWRGKRIVSEEWVRTSTETYSVLSDTRGTVADVDFYGAAGGFGQYIYVFPSLDLVVVFTQYYSNHMDRSQEILSRYVLPAAGADRISP